eukprot:CAMPEP_0202689974 /NCGR_PEP_ID=MMETSP1385-20130828/5133_1 /ASSEMBLY_ACC=CAM_ASM_000861 /TAXON_ID=933848 /ORGANISM="Elphidium margaritaceum" /LENGTH=1064 /DNA_ID=CAMNT_0049345195 /DNA_START=35 /DNA_END=3229 /DNA_ORIENTATION=+
MDAGDNPPEKVEAGSIVEDEMAVLSAMPNEPVQDEEAPDEAVDVDDLFRDEKSEHESLMPAKRNESSLSPSPAARAANSRSAPPGAGNSSSALKSTLKKNQRSWVDPYEPAVQDTFYHKQINTLRPNFDMMSERITGIQPLGDLFLDGNDQIMEEVDSPTVADEEDAELEQEEQAYKDKKHDVRQFGMWDGVIARNLLNIFGVIMFLRIGFMVGQAGILQSFAIILISSFVVLLTSLSMSAICTNGTILSGGAYYMISRALGPSVGGAIGILFSIGNMCAISLYLIGFAETLRDNLYEWTGFFLIDNGIWDVRVWSTVALVAVLILAIVGLGCVVKTQLALLVFILISIVLFFVGSTYRTFTNHEFPDPAFPEYFDACVAGDPCPETISYVTVTPKGWSNGNLGENMSSRYTADETMDHTFWTVFAIFFPAVTGIMAGANISGELKDPAHDIPNGTMISIIFSAIMYMLMSFVCGAVTVRYELLTNDLVMAYICVSEYLIYAGIYAATLSSAIASLVGAPRILQAVALDNLFPFKVVQYFAVLRKGEPIRGYFLSFVVALGCNLIGELNAIAPLISEFFILTYLLINFACFALAVSKSPGWRPSFKYFNRWTAGVGTLACAVIMFLLNWVYALIASLIAIILFGYVWMTDPDVNWGAAPQARRYYDAYRSLLALRKNKQHIKTWRPSFLVLVRDPVKLPRLLLFSQTLKKTHSALFYATVKTGDYRTNIRKFHELKSGGYLPSACPTKGSKHAKGFYQTVISDSLRSGVQSLIQLVGTGAMVPNGVIIGFKSKWQTDADETVHEYVQILRDTLVMGYSLLIVAGFKKINFFLPEYGPPAYSFADDDDEVTTYKSAGMTTGSTSDNERTDTKMSLASVPASEDSVFISKAWADGQGRHSYIDVWWMVDDGGLIMLVPYIMKRHAFWSQCKLRMLMVSEEDTISTDISAMRQLIHNFRLPYEGPLFVPAKKEPSVKTVQRYESLAKCKLSQTARPEVIKKWLILTELLYEYSRYSGLNVVTLPIPTKLMQPRSYMALLEMLSDKNRLPPTLIMRGNGESTLTFYSE